MCIKKNITNKVKMLLKAIENSPYSSLLQFVKFGLVGVSNTLISYTIEILCYYVLFAKTGWPDALRISATSILAFFTSVTNSYILNNRYVFRDDSKKTTVQHIISYTKTVLCYGSTGLVFAPMLKVWLSRMGIPFWIGSFAALIVTIPLNFIMNKFWAFRKSDA